MPSKSVPDVKGVRPYLLRDVSQKALFLDGQGKRLPYHVLLRMVHKYATKAGIEMVVTPHTFRRSCTTEMLRAGAGMYHVKEMLGHESLDTLKHYARLTITDLKKGRIKPTTFNETRDFKVSETVALPEVSEDMDLKDAIALAMKNEEIAMQKYETLAANCDDAELQGVFTSLAAMERDHKFKMEDSFVKVAYPEVW